MKIILKKITIKNFKGIKEFSLEFNPKLTNILGANHTGKTTTADAIHWVLFNKNSEGLTVFGIDPKDENNKIINHLENEVKLTLEADGREMEIMKVRREIWSKPRGQEQEVLGGHETLCYINGNKFTAGDYVLEINKLCPEELFKALTNPAYFPSLKADDQRTLLVKMVGERSIEDIAGEDEGFKSLLQKMGGEDLKRYRQHLAYQMKELKRALDNTPSRISENQEMLQSLNDKGLDFDMIRSRIAEIDKAIEDYDKQLQDNTAILNQSYDKRLEQRGIINGIKGDISKIEEAVTRRNRTKKQEHEEAIDNARQRVNTIKRNIDTAKQEIEDYTARISHTEEAVQRFRKQWEEVEAQTFEWDDSAETCKTCGQRLPEGDIDKLKEEARERFYAKHAKQQDELDQEAKRLKKNKADAEALLRDAQKRRQELTQQLDIAEQQLEGESSKIITFESAEDDERWETLNKELEAARQQLEQITDDPQAMSNSKNITQRKAELVAERDGLRDRLSAEEEIKNRRNRIAELEDRMRTLTQQLTELEQEDTTAERLEYAGIEDLETRVNKLFDNVRFKMFQEQLNGAVKPTCVMTMHGVPYPDLSNSEKILAGIECIQAMSKYNDVYAPVIADNAEAVNAFPEIDSQLILLFVSSDKQLTVIK